MIRVRTLRRNETNVNMLSESRTVHERFESWKGTDKVSKSWREYEARQNEDTIKLYKKLGWKLIAITRDNKRPVKGVKWSERTLTYNNALTLLNKKMNLAVKLDDSNLTVADIDDNKVPISLKPCVDRTISVITKSNHYHIYFNYDADYDKSDLNKLSTRLNVSKTMWRGLPNKSQYTLVPLSCVDKRYYEFVGSNSLMNLSELMG
jgi:hypothetical protein